MTPDKQIPSPEDTLIQRAKEGDRDAFGELVQIYQDQVYNLACRTMGDPDRAKDTAQEAFIRAWRAISRFKGQSKFSSWLYRITVNACLSELRQKSKPVDQYEQIELDKVKPAGIKSENIETTLEKRDLVEKLIKELPPAYRSIVVLFYIQDLDCKEISAVLGHPVGTIKAYLHRAREQMRRNADMYLKTRSTSP